MPNFKNGSFFNTNLAPEFDRVLTPGTPTPVSGIYRCDSYGFEAVSTAGHPLPPAELCGQHSSSWRCNHGLVRWRLVAAAIHVSRN